MTATQHQFDETQITYLARMGFSMEPMFDHATLTNVLQLTHPNSESVNLTRLTENIYQLSSNVAVFRRGHTFTSFLAATAPHLLVSHITDSIDTFEEDEPIFFVALTAPYTGTLTRKEFLEFFRLYRKDYMTALSVSISIFADEDDEDLDEPDESDQADPPEDDE